MEGPKTSELYRGKMGISGSHLGASYVHSVTDEQSLQ